MRLISLFFPQGTQPLPQHETAELRLPEQETGSPEDRHPSNALTDIIPYNHKFGLTETRV